MSAVSEGGLSPSIVREPQIEECERERALFPRTAWAFENVEHSAEHLLVSLTQVLTRAAPIVLQLNVGSHQQDPALCDGLPRLLDRRSPNRR